MTSLSANRTSSRVSKRNSQTEFFEFVESDGEPSSPPVRRRFGARSTAASSEEFVPSSLAALSNRAAESSQRASSSQSSRQPTELPSAQLDLLHASFANLPRSLSQSQESLRTLANTHQVSVAVCKAAFADFLRAIHPSFVLAGQHKFTSAEGAHLDELFKSDARWATSGADVNLNTLAKVQAQVINAARPPDAPQVEPQSILNRRAAFRAKERNAGQLAIVAPPRLLLHADKFIKQVSATISALETCADDERLLAALRAIEGNVVFIEDYLRLFHEAVNSALRFARRHVDTESEHNISQRAFHFQHILHQFHRNKCDGDNRLYVACDTFVRPIVGAERGIDNVTKLAHQLSFDSAWASMGDALECSGLVVREFMPRPSPEYQGITLRADEYLRLDHVRAFSMLHLGQDTCEMYGLVHVDEFLRDFELAQADEDLIATIARLVPSAPALYHILGYALFATTNAMQLARAAHNEEAGIAFTATSYAFLLAQQDEIAGDLAIKTRAVEQFDNLVYPSPRFFWCVAFPAALVVYTVVVAPSSSHDIDRINSLVASPIMQTFFAERADIFVDEFVPRADDEDHQKVLDGRLRVIMQRTIKAFVEACTRELAARHAKPATMARSSANIAKESADGVRQVSTTTMTSGQSAKRKRPASQKE